MIQFNGPVFSEIPFRLSSQVTGLADQDLPAMLVHRRARWQPTTEPAPGTVKSSRNSLNELGVSWPTFQPLQQALAEIHLGWVHHIVKQRLDDATHVEIVGDLRYVEVLGLYGVVVYQPTRTVVHSYGLQVSADTPSRLVSDAQPASFLFSAIDSKAVAPWLVSQPNWMLAIVRQLLEGYGDATQRRAFECEASLAEMISHAIESKALSQICGRPWTVSIAKAFIRDPVIDQCVRQMYQFCPANSLPMSVSASQARERPELADFAYQLECRREILDKLLREQANLLQPYLALLTCIDHGDHTEPVQWIKQQLRQLGCTPRVWRAILKSDRRLFFVPLSSFDHPLLALSWVIAVIARCETAGPVSPRFIKAIASYAIWSKQRRAANAPAQVSYPGHAVAQQQSQNDAMVIAARPLWRQINAQFDSHATSTGAYPSKNNQPEIALIDQWLSADAASAQRLVSKKSWAVLVRQADQAVRAAFSHLRGGPNWWVADQPIQQPDSELTIVPILNDYELAVQGDRMRNCMRDYRVECTRTMPMYLSVFREQSDKAIAMVELACGNGVWHLHQAAGPANRSIERVLRRRIVKVAKQVAAQMRRLPAGSQENANFSTATVGIADEIADKPESDGSTAEIAESEWLMQDVPVRQVFAEVGFKQDASDDQRMTWDVQIQGAALSYNVTPGQCDDWRVKVTGTGQGAAFSDELFFWPWQVRGEVLVRLANAWSAAFFEVPLPPALKQADVYQELKRAKATVNPGVPQLSVKARSLRFMLNRLRQQIDLAMPTPVSFTLVTGQLAIEVQGEAEHCPATGNWFGTATVNLADLMAIVPRQFERPSVLIEFDNGCLKIEGTAVAAKWKDAAFD